MAKFVVFALLSVLATLSHAANIKNCNSQATVDFSHIQVTGCTGSSQRCIFKKGSDASISLPFTPTFESASVKARAYGIIAGVPIPFRLNNDNACTNSGLTCPLEQGQSYTYQASIPVLRQYPSINVDVKWELKDGNKDLVCILIPVKIES